MLGATLDRTGPLSATITRSCGPRSDAWSDALAGLNQLATLMQAPAVFAQGRECGALREGADIALPGGGQTRTDEAAYGAGPNNGYLHGWDTFVSLAAT